MAQIFGQLIKAQMENLSADPTPVEGQFWINTTTHLVKYSNNGTVRTVANLDEAQTLASKTFTGVVSITLAASGAIDWAAGSVSLGATIGANTLTVGGSTSTVRIAGAFSCLTGSTDSSDWVLNNAAAASGADWKGTFRRPASGMTAAAVWTMPSATGTIAALGIAQTFSALQTFSSGIAIANETLSTYAATSKASTFTDDGTSPGTSASITMHVQRVGDWVTVHVPAFNFTVGSGSPGTITANTALDAAYIPATTTQFGPCNTIRDNAGGSTLAGIFQIGTNGRLAFRKVQAGGFTASTSCGIQQPCVFSYYVGTGS